MELRTRGKAPATRLCGMAAFTIGVSVVTGWFLHYPTLVQVRPGLVAMVFNTALCLTFGGIALVLPDSRSRFGHRIRFAVGVLLLVLGTVVLVENLFDVDAHLDSPELHRWLTDLNPRPGRMAPNTCLGFMLIGASLVLSSTAAWQTSTWRARLPLAASIIGATGILGYFLKLDFLYNWQGATRMALNTAVGITALGAGLWLEARDRRKHAATSNDGRDIFSAVAVSLVAVTVVAGISGFAILQSRVEQITTDDLVRQHQDRSQFLESVIEQRTQRAETITTRITAVAQLRRLTPGSSGGRARGLLHDVAQSYLPHDFTWVAFYQNNRLVTAAGSPRAQPALEVALNGRKQRELLWDQGYYLRVRLPIRDAAGIVGEVVAEQPLEIFAHLTEQDRAWGKSGEMVLCELSSTPFRCFPGRFHGEPFTIPHVSENHRVPMTYAIGDQTGVITSFDYRGERVLASYGPIGAYGLGMVIKMDWAELFAPVREQLQLMLALLVAVASLSLWLVHVRLRPLVQQLVESRRAAQASEARLLAAAEATQDAFCILDSVRNKNGDIEDFLFRYLNDKAAHLAELPRHALIGQRLCKMLPRIRAEGYFEKYKRVVDSGEALIEELHAVWPRTTDWWLSQQVVPLGDGVAITARDITERKQVEEKLTRMAQHDALTGLPNRALFFDRLEQALVRARRNAQPMALLYLDIDRFKQINDVFGHAAGDAVLRAFAHRLRSCLRPSDTIARMAGDEFTVILENLHDPAHVGVLADKIMEGLRAPAKFEGADIALSASIGIALYRGEPSAELSCEALLARADKALYDAKHEGRRRYRVYRTVGETT